MFPIANAAEVAQTAAKPAASFTSFIPLIAIFAVFYFLIIRPQSKRVKAEQQMRSALQIGNKVVTTSGIFGSIVEIDSEKGVVSLNIAEGTNITLYKNSIASVLKKEETQKEKPNKPKAVAKTKKAPVKNNTPEKAEK